MTLIIIKFGNDKPHGNKSDEITYVTETPYTTIGQVTALINQCFELGDDNDISYTSVKSDNVTTYQSSQDLHIKDAVQFTAKTDSHQKRKITTITIDMTKLSIQSLSGKFSNLFYTLETVTAPTTQLIYHQTKYAINAHEEVTTTCHEKKQIVPSSWIGILHNIFKSGDIKEYSVLTDPNSPPAIPYRKLAQNQDGKPTITRGPFTITFPNKATSPLAHELVTITLDTTANENDVAADQYTTEIVNNSFLDYFKNSDEKPLPPVALIRDDNDDDNDSDEYLVIHFESNAKIDTIFQPNHAAEIKNLCFALSLCQSLSPTPKTHQETGYLNHYEKETLVIEFEHTQFEILSKDRTLRIKKKNAPQYLLPTVDITKFEQPKQPIEKCPVNQDNDETRPSLVREEPSLPSGLNTRNTEEKNETEEKQAPAHSTNKKVTHSPGNFFGNAINFTFNHTASGNRQINNHNQVNNAFVKSTCLALTAGLASYFIAQSAGTAFVALLVSYAFYFTINRLLAHLDNQPKQAPDKNQAIPLLLQHRSS